MKANARLGSPLRILHSLVLLFALVLPGMLTASAASPQQWIVALPANDRVTGRGFTTGAPVTLQIYDPATPDFPVAYEAQAIPVSGSPYSTVDFRLRTVFDLQPGQTITLSQDGLPDRVYTVQYVEITGLNVINDRVTGLAEPGATVEVAVTRANGDYYTRLIPTDPVSGAWTADFSTVGSVGEPALDLGAGDTFMAMGYDADRDRVRSTWGDYPVGLGMELLPASNEVVSWGWARNKQVTLTIDDPATLVVDYTTWQSKRPRPGDVDVPLYDFYQLKPGDTVTLSDGEHSLTRQVPDIRVDAVDVLANRITGHAPAGSQVWVEVFGESMNSSRCTGAGEDGSWWVEFTTRGDAGCGWGGGASPFTLEPGSQGRARIVHGDGTYSATPWYVGWPPPDPQNMLVFAVNETPVLETATTDQSSYLPLQNLLEPLFRTRDVTGLEPASALGYDVSLDGLVYTVHLRPGMLWSDGQPVTAQHYVDGLLRALDPQNELSDPSPLFGIANARAYYEGTLADPIQVGLAALDPLTLQISLSAPAYYFPQILAEYLVLPARQDLIDLYGVSWTDPGHFASNGPYLLVEKDGAHLLLERNPRYYRPEQVTYPSVAFSVVPPYDQFAAYRRGEVDVVLDPPAQFGLHDPALQTARHLSPRAYVSYVGFDVRRAPADDPIVRRALAMAIDKFLIVEGSNRPESLPAQGVISPLLPGYQGEAVGHAYDPDQARALLAQAGYPNGGGFPTLEIAAPQFQFPVIEEVARQWRETLGIPVHTIYYAEIMNVLQSCQVNPANCANQAFRGGWGIDHPDGYNVLNDLFHPDGPYNYTNWDNPRYRELMSLLPATTDEAVRLGYQQEAERILVQDETAVIPLVYYTKKVNLVRPGIYPQFELMWNMAYLVRWGSSDADGDGSNDLVDPCPGDAADLCDPLGSAAGVIGAGGGGLITEDSSAGLVVPPGALANDVTLEITDGGTDLQLTNDLQAVEPAVNVQIGPEGTQFAEPAAITLGWPDSNNDGWVDGLNLPESELRVFKDGGEIAGPCPSDPDCDPQANTFSVTVNSLSQFFLGVPLPYIVSITGPAAPARINTLVTVSASIQDAGQNDTYTVTWDWGDNTTTSGESASGSTTVSAQHIYMQTGVYPIHLTIMADSYDPVSLAYEYAVVYDPDGGFVTGGGWLWSPTGAYRADPGLAGKAIFGFVSRYQKGASLPDGSTEFQFKAGELNFHSHSYDWLVVNKASSRAQFKGQGTVNGRLAPNDAAYQFMIWAVDGSPDVFRIKIWWEDDGGEQVVYDNGVEQAIGGGSIVVHVP